MTDQPRTFTLFIDQYEDVWRELLRLNEVVKGVGRVAGMTGFATGCAVGAVLASFLMSWIVSFTLAVGAGLLVLFAKRVLVEFPARRRSYTRSRSDLIHASDRVGIAKGDILLALRSFETEGGVEPRVMMTKSLPRMYSHGSAFRNLLALK